MAVTRFDARLAESLLEATQPLYGRREGMFSWNLHKLSELHKWPNGGKKRKAELLELARRSPMNEGLYWDLTQENLTDVQRRRVSTHLDLLAAAK